MAAVLDDLHSIELEHKEVQKLHQLHVKAEEFSYKLLEDVAAHLKSEVSDDKILKNNEQPEEKFDAFLERRDKLMANYNIVWDKDSYKNGYNMKCDTDE